MVHCLDDIPGKKSFVKSHISMLNNGVTIIELLIVLLVLSILVVVSYPGYQAQMQENRRTDGKKMLLEVMHEQEKFYSRYSTYTTDLVAPDPSGLAYDDPNGDGTLPSDKNFYLVTAQACVSSTIEQCVLLTAAPQAGQSDDGPLTINSRNQKTPATHW